VVLSGDVLSQWLQRRNGSVVVGSQIALTRSGLLRVSAALDSRPVQVGLPVMHGGQAAVARTVDQAGAVWALRVQTVSSQQERTRQMERLVNMTTVASAAKERPDRFPAVLPVAESFMLVVPGEQLPLTGPEPEYELWCDLMAWCPHDLNDWHRSTTGEVRSLPAVVAAFVPVLATVHAVHEDLGIVHRDITPNNVLVDDSGRLRLADWGIAHGLGEGQTSTYTQLVGNRGFALPPEMIAGDPSVGRYTDAWYLGCLLAWMLTGQPSGPQHGPTWLPPGLPTGPLGAQVAAVIAGLCHPDPRLRLDLAQAGAHLHATAQGRVTAPLVLPAATAAANLASIPTHPVGQSQVLTSSQAPGGLAPPVMVGPPPPRRAKTGLWVAVTAVLVCIALVGGALAWSAITKDTQTPDTAKAGGASTPQLPAVEGEACLVGTWEIELADLLTSDDQQSIDEAMDSPDVTVDGTATVELSRARHYTSTKDAVFSWTDASGPQEIPFRDVKDGNYRLDGDAVVFTPTEHSQTLGDSTSQHWGTGDESRWTSYTCSGNTLTVSQTDAAGKVQESTLHRK